MNLSNIDVQATLRTTCVDPATSQEIYDKILDVTAPGSMYFTKNFYDLLLLDLPNGVLLGTNIQQDIPVDDILIGTGDDSTTTFDYTVSGLPVKPNSVSIAYTYNDGTNDVNETAQDDGNGNITATNISTGTINYTTGEIHLEFTHAPKAGTPIKLNYTIGSASDDNLQVGFYFDLATDAQPVLDNNSFAELIGLQTTPVKVDWFQTESAYVYRVLMGANFTNTTDSAKITGIQIGYQAAKGPATGVTVYDQLIMKSIATNKTALYGESGLILKNKTSITLDLRFVVTKK